jgi:hypothetical protein
MMNIAAPKHLHCQANSIICYNMSSLPCNVFIDVVGAPLRHSLVSIPRIYPRPLGIGIGVRQAQFRELGFVCADPRITGTAHRAGQPYLFAINTSHGLFLIRNEQLLMMKGHRTV